jgi:hypothetical protein
VSEASGSYSRVSVSVGSDWRVRCLPAAGHSPVLDIDAGEIEVSFSLASRDIRASVVEFAAIPALPVPSESICRGWRSAGVRTGPRGGCGCSAHTSWSRAPPAPEKAQSSGP